MYSGHGGNAVVRFREGGVQTALSHETVTSLSAKEPLPGLPRTAASRLRRGCLYDNGSLSLLHAQSTLLQFNIRTFGGAPGARAKNERVLRSKRPP